VPLGSTRVRVTMDGLKVCAECDTAKLVAEFRRRGKQKLVTGEPVRSSYCRPCEKRRYAERWLRNKERMYSVKLAWNASNRDKVNAYSKRVKQKVKADPVRSEKVRVRTNQNYAQIRQEMLGHYGRRCACCGEARDAFLTVEHSFRDGKEHRSKVGPSYVVKDLKRRGWPTDAGIKILCIGCNWVTRNGGECPHVTEQAAAFTELRAAVRASWAQEVQF
jgi:hypothetical protein